MFDVLTAFLGPRVCAWCTGREIPLYSRLYNLIPDRVHRLIYKSGYDDWVGRVGGGWHHKHHYKSDEDET